MAVDHLPFVTGRVHISAKGMCRKRKRLWLSRLSITLYVSSLLCVRITLSCDLVTPWLCEPSADMLMKPLLLLLQQPLAVRPSVTSAILSLPITAILTRCDAALRAPALARPAVSPPLLGVPLPPPLPLLLLLLLLLQTRCRGDSIYTQHPRARDN